MCNSDGRAMGVSCRSDRSGGDSSTRRETVGIKGVMAICVGRNCKGRS